MDFQFFGGHPILSWSFRFALTERENLFNNCRFLYWNLVQTIGEFLWNF